ncbi:fasciclin [Culex quinquefasciatus]|uniref:Fasciclin n=1 Tax=Culex quinquefasciatus TaxID=7176 RepID=B0WDB8_CULQU|nr:fasciclin [Culex quinquefasciatus]|eukprot:XP_001846702.1 fasciclin [Culex quinquefasciatus]
MRSEKAHSIRHYRERGLTVRDDTEGDVSDSRFTVAAAATPSTTFTLPSSSQQVALTPGQPAANGLQYFGEGYQKGQCGVTIDRITTAHNGQVKCSVFVDGLSAEGLIDVVVAVSPSQPTIQLEPETTYFEAGKQITAHCVTTGGNPDPQLAWFLENDPIYDGVDKQQDFEQDGTTGTALTLRRIINGNDNGKRLICQARHLAYPEGSSQTSLQLAVSFPPLYLPEHTIHGLTLGRTVDVTLVIEANPKPRTHWTVDGVGIEEGTEQDRFAARVPEQLESGAYNVTLTIAGLTLEDLTKKYTLRASNDFGVQDYTVMLSSLDAEVDESGGVGIGGIIGIVLAALIVLAAVALILVARATGRWCFRGASLNTDIGPDSEAQIAPHSHEDLHDEKLQQQNPAVHYGEGDEKSAATTDSAKPAAEKDAKEKNGGTTKQENGKKHENGKADKTNTPV